FYNPKIFLAQSEAIKTEWLSLLNKLSVQLPVNDVSRQNRLYTTVEVYQDWAILLKTWRWSLGWTAELKQSLFPESSLLSSNLTTLDFDTGHYLTYYFSPRFDLNTSTYFTFKHTSFQKNWWEMDQGSVDNFTFMPEFSPFLYKFKIGTYFRTPIYYPTFS